MSAVIRVNAYHRNPIRYVENMKLEKGSVATPWVPAVEDNVQPKYMGTYTDYIQADSSDPTKYLWSQIKGEAGANGKDGQDAYLHIAYANSVDGKTEFTTDQDQAHNRDYLGTYSDDTKAQSTDPTKYTWQLTRGAQGLQGQPGSKDVPVVTMSSTAPPSPKDGDFWYQTTTDSSGQKITGFSVYSGGKWVPSKIDQSTLVLTKLVSVEIDSATINSPDITVPFDYFDEVLNEYTGSMEFKDGMLKHISTMTGGGMLKTVVSPAGYTLDAYANQSEYTANNSYIHTEVYGDNISVSNANTAKSGILDSSGIAGTLNDSTDSSIGIDISWSDVQKYLSEMGQTGSKRAFNWFDMLNSSSSHPNLLKNSSFKDGITNWTFKQGTWYHTSNGHDGNYGVALNNGSVSDAAFQHLVTVPSVGALLNLSYWGVNYGGGGTAANNGMAVSFEKTDSSAINRYNCMMSNSAPTGQWTYYEFEPLVVPDGTKVVSIMFYTKDGLGHMAISQPMLNLGSHIWPYQPT